MSERCHWNCVLQFLESFSNFSIYFVKMSVCKPITTVPFIPLPAAKPLFSPCQIFKLNSHKTKTNVLQSYKNILNLQKKKSWRSRTVTLSLSCIKHSKTENTSTCWWTPVSAESSGPFSEIVAISMTPPPDSTQAVLWRPLIIFIVAASSTEILSPRTCFWMGQDMSNLWTLDLRRSFRYARRVQLFIYATTLPITAMRG